MINSEKFYITKPIRLIELFAGIGSQAKALKNIGADFEHYKVVEFDKFSIASYNAIHGTNFVPLDITKIKGSDLEIVDTNNYCYIMTYSFPCQDLSLVGKQTGMSKGSSTRSGLLWEVERLLNETKELPHILLMENVPQVHGNKNILDFEKWIEFLQIKGYSNYWKDLNAKDYGIPQNRNRTFMVSILGSFKYDFPNPIALRSYVFNYLENNVNLKYYLSNKMIKYISSTGSKNFKNSDCKINLNVSRPLTTCPNKRAGTSNYLCSELPINFDLLTLSSFDNLYIRRYTPLEYWRLMGFDDEDFLKSAKVNSDTQLYKQAGNSIVVYVLEKIFMEFFYGS